MSVNMLYRYAIGVFLLGIYTALEYGIFLYVVLNVLVVHMYMYIGKRSIFSITNYNDELHGSNKL